MKKQEEGASPAEEELEFELEEPKRSTARSLDGALLFLVGSGFAASGLVLAAAPNLSWQLTKISMKLSELGLHNGTMFMGGMTLVGIGMVARAIAHAAHQASEESSDTAAVCEQLAYDIGQLNAAQARIDHRVSAMAQALPGEVAAMVANSEVQAAEEEDASNDAMWRIAASLDQLGARVERELCDQNVRMEEQLESFAKCIEELNATHRAAAQQLEQKFASSEAVVADEPAPAAPSAPAPEMAQLSDPEPALAAEPTPDLGQSDGGDVMHDLEEIDFLNEPETDALDEPPAALPKAVNEEPVDVDALLPDEKIEDELNRRRQA